MNTETTVNQTAWEGAHQELSPMVSVILLSICIVIFIKVGIHAKRKNLIKPLSPPQQPAIHPRDRDLARQLVEAGQQQIQFASPISAVAQEVIVVEAAAVAHEVRIVGPEALDSSTSAGTATAVRIAPS